MQNHSWVGLVLLLGVGLAVFAFSLYTASLAGLKRQLGIVGGDVASSIDNVTLYRGLLEEGQLQNCDYWSSIAAIPRYVVAKGEERLRLGRNLASARFYCAMDYILSGNAERGVYTLLKALRYEMSSLILVEQSIRKDRGACTWYQSSAAYGLVEAYLTATQGAARGVIEREYQEVQRLRNEVQQLCLIR